MSNKPHSPGPWRVEWIRNSVYIKAQDTDRDISVCRVMMHRDSNNIDVLTYAPDMLSLLERLVEAVTEDEFNSAYSQADSLVRKMKGTYNA